jgi:hypothetical protein
MINQSGLVEIKNLLWLPDVAIIYLFQGLLPAVALFAEWASKLLGVGPVTLTTLTPIQVLDAHLLLEVLLEARLVGELPEAVGTLERPVLPVVGRLGVVVEEPLFGEVLAAVQTHKRTFPGVDAVVNVEVRFPGVAFRADGADERFFAGVHADVFLQRVVVVARLVAQRAHEVRRSRVRRHVRPEGRLPAEAFSALPAAEVSLPGVRHEVRRQVVTIGEHLVAVVARVDVSAASDVSGALRRPSVVVVVRRQVRQVVVVKFLRF